MTDPASRWNARTRWGIAIGFVACWIVGLSIGGPALAPSANAADVVAEFSGSPTHLLFAALVHGVAALLLVALGRSLEPMTTSRATVALAVTAGGLSLVQLAGEALLVAAPEAVPGDVVWQTITRADGAKMLILAGLVAVVHGRRSRRYVVLSTVSAAACLSLIGSGIGYLALNPLLMESAAASLPFLLVWALVATAARVAEARREDDEPTVH